MRNLPYLTVLLACASIFNGGCSKNPVQNVMDLYKNGKLSEDSLLAYISDSANQKIVYEWANNHKGDKDMADFLLGRCYKFGLGTDRDPIKSKAYYINAALNGNVNAMNGLAGLYAGYPNYENLDSALFWFNKAAEKGDGRGYYSMILIENQKRFNEGLPIDTAKTLQYLQKGADLKDPYCTSQLAMHYAMGIGVNKDINIAFKMLRMFPEDKLDGQGLFYLAQFYETGEGTQTNFNEALRLIKLSANKGDTYAICKLGNFYQFGQGVEQNDSLAYIYYKKAADAGNPCGMRCVGSCYMNGIGVEQNITNAWVWYKSAAKSGDEEAIKYCKQKNIDFK